MLNVTLKPSDAAILWKNQESDVDSRVPTAEELAATEQLLRQHIVASRAGIRPNGWLERPTLSIVGSQVIAGNLQPWSAAHPALSPIPQLALTLPAVSGEVDRRDYLCLMAFSVVVGVAQDPDVALEFSWREGAALQTLTKENTGRIRDGWAVIGCSTTGQDLPITAQQIAQALAGQITISRQLSYVLAPGLPQFWVQGLDGSLTEQIYTLIGEIELIPLCRVWRRVSTNNATGYLEHSSGAERPLEAAIHLEPCYRYVGDGWDNWPLRVQESLYRLGQGQALQGSPRMRRWVYNLINGQVGANPDAPGIPTYTLANELLLANGQRTVFSNAAITAVSWLSLQVTINDGTGKAKASVSLAAGAPVGTTFAATGHQVFTTAGADVTANGTFTGGGTAGPLEWVATSGVSVGASVYVLPAISYPAGAGFPVSGTLEAAYLNASAVPDANLQSTPLTGYRSAESPNPYVVVANPATGGIQIYKQESLTASAGGVVTVPAGVGAIAYISGPSAPATLQNKPVITGLVANETYTVLCHYAPTAEEQWQMQFLAPQYAGQRRVDWLNGATITTPWVALAHRLGSQAGGGVGLSNHALALRLPRRTVAAVMAYQLGTGLLPEALGLVQDWQARGGNNPAIAGLGLAASAEATTEPNCLRATLAANGLPLDSAKPVVTGGHYQLVLACGVRRATGEPAMLVATINGLAGAVVALEGADVAFDVFNLW